MYKIAVIGDRDSIYGFASLGLSVYPCDDSEDSMSIIKNLVKNNFGIIYITENLYNDLGESLDRYREMTVPAIIPIPGLNGNTGVGMSEVSRFIEKAVGSDIID